MTAKINGQKVNFKKGETVLNVCLRQGIDLPALCYHSDLAIKASCRLCMIEIKGRPGLYPACATEIKPAMEILTDSPLIKRIRRVNLSLVFNHQPELLAFSRKYKIKIINFPGRKKKDPVEKFGPAIGFNKARCINCRHCLEVCQKQQVDFYDIYEKNTFHEVSTSRQAAKDCVYCGQCVVHCPVGALLTIDDIEKTEKAIKDKNITTVVQFAPSIRTSLGEAFGLPYGKIVTGQLIAALRALGFDYVYDTSLGADFTTFEEARELMEKIEKKQTPCLSSCCPAWVKFIEFYYPQFIKYIATTRSPQMILGGLVKTYFSRQKNISPSKIKVISVMPCTAKKYEAARPELKINGRLKPIDLVITTVELAEMMKKHGLDLKNIKPEKPDNPFGLHSGAGVIYGASGGVMESVLRTVYYWTNKKNLPRNIFQKVRGNRNIREAGFKIKGRSVKIAVASGLENAKYILDKLAKDRQAYQGVEIMACPSGCIGGGGQFLPVNQTIRQKRAASLYQIDAKKKISRADENPVLQEIYRDFLASKKERHLICHTGYSKKKREVKIT